MKWFLVFVCGLARHTFRKDFVSYTTDEKMDTRRLLEECADLHVYGSDLQRIPCSKFQVSTKCDVLRYVLEDFDTKEIPFPNIPGNSLRLAMELIHNITHVNDLSLVQIDLADQGFDVLGTTCVDTTARIWSLIEFSGLDAIRPRLPKLMRSTHVNKDAIIQTCLNYDSSLPGIQKTIYTCQPDFELGMYLMKRLCKYVPVCFLFRCLLKSIPNMTLSKALQVVSSDVMYPYVHPLEVSCMLAILKSTFVEDSVISKFIYSMAGAMHTYDMAPLSSSTLFGNVIMFHDSQHTSACLKLDGTAPSRRVVISKFLKFHLVDNVPVLTVKADKIDVLARISNKLDIRVVADHDNGQKTYAEMWYSWTTPAWGPRMEVSTTEDSCPRITGNVDDFNTYVLAGIRRKRMTFRIDIFYGTISALDRPPLM